MEMDEDARLQRGQHVEELVADIAARLHDVGRIDEQEIPALKLREDFHVDRLNGLVVDGVAARAVLAKKLMQQRGVGLHESHVDLTTKEAIDRVDSTRRGVA